MILVTGASGKSGKDIIRSLSREARVCALVHREEQVEMMKSCGADKVIVGHLLDESTVRSAMEGVQRVYHICPNMHPAEVEIGRLVLAEAQKAGVEHFVYHSVLHPQTEKMKHHWGKMRVEEMIFESGIPFTILQSAPYMQNLLANWKNIVENGVLRVPYSVESKFSFVDLEDVAEAAKVVLMKSNHKNAIYELAGTLPTSHMEVAEILRRVLNCDVCAEKESISDWKRRTNEMSEYARKNLVAMFEYYDQWSLVGNPNVLRWILNREPTSLETFVERTVNENNAAN
jgi:uncharacterized protein YbjT (DUF2867 family)